MTGDELHRLQMEEHAIRKRTKKTVEKLLQLTSTATDHDIRTKIVQAEEWLLKGDSVKVLILGRADLKPRMVRANRQWFCREFV